MGLELPVRAETERLRGFGIRPTRPRLIISALIANGGHRHLTADCLHREAMEGGLKVSLATVYNTLHEFAGAGMVRRIDFGERTFFCTNTKPHHHFYDESTGRLEDIPGDLPVLGDLPAPPKGMTIAAVDVVIRIRPERDGGCC